MIFRARNVVFLLYIAAFVFADDELEKKNKTTTQPPSTSTTPVTTITPTPPPPPTTSSPTTTSSPPTTSSTTTTTTTTTQKPTTTPSPTPTPTPTPSPKNEDWIVKGPNDTICIIAKMVINIDVQYETNKNKTLVAPFSVKQVQDATANGTCADPNAESLVLKWSNVTATFNFNTNASANTYFLDSVNISIAVNNETFPDNTMNATEVQLIYEGKLFSVPVNKSYTCSELKPVTLNGTIPATNATLAGEHKLSITKVQIQAFGTETSVKYYEAMDCHSSETPDIVPIVVGLVLAGLVIIVLVAYLVGRRRAQSRGYLSM